ncbi:MAG: chromate efflux transporter [Rhizobiales bacterium]|nr:chromate efflux transporter [Hyphomicrobiales bacterium]
MEKPIKVSNPNQQSFSELINVFLKIGLLSFGGPAAQISMMHRILVDETKWLKEKQFLNALSFCMFLPGPEAMQLATYAGWRLKGILGGLIAGLLFVLPGAIVMLGLAIIYAYYGNLTIMNTLFLGIKAAVLIIVIEALLRVSKKALKNNESWFIAIAAFIGIFFLKLPYPLIVLAAALYGFFCMAKEQKDVTESKHQSVSFQRTASTIIIGGLIWALPFAALAMMSSNPILTDIGSFFSKLAVVTFGGAYAVLAYMGQDVVSQYGWLNPGQMMDGLGLAETTPGPLILVTEFVGFLAAFKEGGIWLGVSGALMTLWVTFVPCFLWIFAGAPYIEWISAQPRLSGALNAITAAVVGVILNLSIWFGLHVFFAKVTPTSYGPVTLWQPDLATLNWQVVALFILCAVLLLKFHWGITRVLLISAAAAFGLSFI